MNATGLAPEQEGIEAHGDPRFCRGVLTGPVSLPGTDDGVMRVTA